MKGKFWGLKLGEFSYPIQFLMEEKYQETTLVKLLLTQFPNSQVIFHSFNHTTDKKRPDSFLKIILLPCPANYKKNLEELPTEEIVRQKEVNYMYSHRKGGVLIYSLNSRQKLWHLYADLENPQELFFRFLARILALALSTRFDLVGFWGESLKNNETILRLNMAASFKGNSLWFDLFHRKIWELSPEGIKILPHKWEQAILKIPHRSLRPENSKVLILQKESIYTALSLHNCFLGPWPQYASHADLLYRSFINAFSYLVDEERVQLES